MTREGTVLQQYSNVRTRPFSMFTPIEDNRKANEAWRQEGLSWAESRFDKFGHRTLVKLTTEEPEGL